MLWSLSPIELELIMTKFTQRYLPFWGRAILLPIFGLFLYSTIGLAFDSITSITIDNVGTLPNSTSWILDNPLVSGLVAVLITALVTWKVATRRMRHEQKLAVHNFILEARSQVIEAKRKRHELLYSRLKALLAQSKALYDHMCTQLHDKDDNAKYEWIDDENSTSGRSFQICLGDDEWKSFRLLTAFPLIYKNDKHVIPLVDEIIAIGEELSKTIRKYAGMVSPSEDELTITLGEYLSHFTVMKGVWESVKNKDEPLEHTEGFYPRRLNKLVDKGYTTISEEIESWEEEIDSLSSKIIENLSK